ncbi:uncharacterized protein LOC143276033 [Babylonia areolata]|uniref:uncharacterized protein LOC143276033 n=1 Tax=Babylonia areolata TaxID=304850 RepID=UPI003FD3AEBB
MEGHRRSGGGTPGVKEIRWRDTRDQVEGHKVCDRDQVKGHRLCDRDQVEGHKVCDRDQGLCRYWPRLEAPVKTGDYTISLKAETSLGKHLTSYTVDMKKADQRREVRVLHHEAWTGEVTHSVLDLLRLLDVLNTSHRQSPKEPIIVQCIYGIDTNGLNPDYGRGEGEVNHLI